MTFLSIIHILFGGGAICCLVVAYLSKKGGDYHRKSGKVYCYLMTLVLLSALLLSLFTSNHFLMLVTLFSGYLTYTGWRLAANHNNNFTALDINIVIGTLITSICMLAYGGWLWLKGGELGPVLIIFAAIGGYFSFLDTRRYTADKKWPTGRDRIILHVGRIGGSAIAIITAVFVVNIKTEPVYITWLLPTLVITPIIAYWSRRVRVGKI